MGKEKCVGGGGLATRQLESGRKNREKWTIKRVGGGDVGDQATSITVNKSDRVLKLG